MDIIGPECYVYIELEFVVDLPSLAPFIFVYIYMYNIYTSYKYLYNNLVYFRSSLKYS